MDGWNPPNDLTSEFNATVENTNENSKSETSSESQSPTFVTAAEKERLENEREQPVLELNLEMDGENANNARIQAAQNREERINHIRERLNAAQQNFRENFDKAKHSSSLKYTFNRNSSGGRKQ